MMSSFLSYLRALRRPYTYDFRRNSYLWLGVFWGLLFPCFVCAHDLSLAGSAGPSGVLEIFRTKPSHAVLFLNPVVLAVLFGAAGSIREDLLIENARLMKTLEQLAMTDPLTGLHNRRYLSGAVQILRESCRRTGNSLFIVLIDIDGFKAINDRQGHVRGDQVLCDIASALKRSLRQADLLGRHGGDEFILAGLGDRTAAEALVARSAEAVRSAVQLGFSYGLGCWPEDGNEIDDLIDLADQSLKASKKRSQDSRTLPKVPHPQEGP